MQKQIAFEQLIFAKSAVDRCTRREEDLARAFRLSHAREKNVPDTDLQAWMNDDGKLVIVVKIADVKEIWVVLRKGEWRYSH